MIENKTLKSQAKDKDENIRYLSAPNLDHTDKNNMDKKLNEGSKHNSSNNKYLTSLNHEIDEEEIINIDSSMEFQEEQTEKRKTDNKESKIATIFNKIKTSNKNKKLEENMHKGSESDKNEIQDIDNSLTESSEITDIDMILESHQDMLQFIHLMALASEVNFT